MHAYVTVLPPAPLGARKQLTVRLGEDPVGLRVLCSLWSGLRPRISFAGKSVPLELRRDYNAAKDEFRRRIGG